MHRVVPAVIAPFIAVIVTASGGCASRTERTTQFSVATTVAPITDIVRRIVGKQAEVVQLIPSGVDSHTFEPSPQTVRDLSTSDVVFLNGLNLDEQLERLARSDREHPRRVVLLGNETITPEAYAYDFSFPRSQGSPNPHVWMNPIYAQNYGRIVANTLAEEDPANASTYRANLRGFESEIAGLDAATFASIATIPPANRKLLTYHDSFAYFAPRYGLSVVGAIQPSSFGEPSARDVAALVEQIRREKVPAIFGSEVFPSPVLEQVARESGAQYVDALRDDELPGPPGSAQHSYFGMISEDVATITSALGGHAPAGLTATSATETTPESAPTLRAQQT